MSDNKKTDSPSTKATKEAANTKLPSSPATFEDTYPTVSESRLRDSPEQITHKDYHEDFVVVSTTATPAPGGLETNGKAYGSVGSVGVEGVEGGLSMRNEAARKGMVTEEDYVFVGGTEKEKKEVKGKKEGKGEKKEGGK